MESIGAASIVAALAGAEPGWVATDADGTLWSGDVGEDWLDVVASGASGVDDAWVARAAERLVGPRADAVAVVRGAREAFAAGVLGELDYFALVALTLGGAGEEAIRPRVRAGLARARLAERVIEETRAVITGARAHGHRVVVVSASPRVIVEEAVALAGLDVDHVIGLEQTNDGLHTRTPFPYAHGKAELLSAHIDRGTVHAALGDSAFDAAMLALARQPLAVRPRPALVSVAASVPGLRLLARDHSR
jgi:phosphatidylglycerophosphatase C